MMDPDALNEAQGKLQEALAILTGRASLGAGAQDRLRSLIQGVLDELTTSDQGAEGAEGDMPMAQNDRMNGMLRSLGGR